MSEINHRNQFWRKPSIFYYLRSNTAVRFVAVLGIFLSCVGLLGIEFAGWGPTVILLLVLWTAYLSLTNVGSIFYNNLSSYLLEAGFLAIFLGGAYTEISIYAVFLVRWLLFRVVLGAGLVKFVGEGIWRQFEALKYFFETQLFPNTLSWFFHKVPNSILKSSVLIVFIIEIISPFLFFFPAPVSVVAGIMIVSFQILLFLGGNFAWTNVLTISLGFFLVPDHYFHLLTQIRSPTNLAPISVFKEYALFAVLILVAFLSVPVIRQMVFRIRDHSLPRLTNLHLVNFYNVYGTVHRSRYEYVIQGRFEDDEQWTSFEFFGKPTLTDNRPGFWAPYHFPLEMVMHFDSMSNNIRYWFLSFLEQILEGRDHVRNLMKRNPFNGRRNAPDQVRVLRYKYRFSTFGELNETGEWWKREFVEVSLPATDLNGIRDLIN